MKQPPEISIDEGRRGLKGLLFIGLALGLALVLQAASLYLADREVKNVMAQHQEISGRMASHLASSGHAQAVHAEHEQIELSLYREAESSDLQMEKTLERLFRFNAAVFVFVAALFVAAGLVVWRIGRDMAAAVREAVGNSLLLAEANQELSEIKAALDEKIAERSAGLIAANDALQMEILARTDVESRARDAVRTAAEASVVKSRFLARMSHEIRTPLNGIIGMTDLALAVDLPERAVKFLEMARSSAGNLLSIVNDLLDFSKLESRELVLRPATFSLERLLAGAREDIRPRAESKAITFSHEIDPAVPDALIGDAERLRQVISHLLRNLVERAGPKPVEIRLKVSCMGDGPAGAAILRFSVCDPVNRLPADLRESIREAFCQATAEGGDLYVGAGLGLFFATELVNLMGGRIWLDDDGGPGTTIHFSVALGKGRAAPASRESLDGEGCVLVAEDDPVNSGLLMVMIEMDGWRAKTVANGLEAVESVRAGGYPVILMDLEMPEMNGLQATAAIREIERETGGRRTIVAITAYDDDEDRQRCLEAGMDTFLPKPIVAERLHALLRRHMPAVSG